MRNVRRYWHNDADLQSRYPNNKLDIVCVVNHNNIVVDMYFTKPIAAPPHSLL